MNIFVQLNKITAIIGLLIIGYNAKAMIVGSSCLTRCINQQNTHKIIILYDKHEDPSEPTKVSHVKDMITFVDALAHNTQEVPFFVEISERHQDPTIKNNLASSPLSPGNIPIQLALTHNMHYKNINFIAFDQRKHSDYWTRDMLLQTDQFAQAINQNYPFPPHFYDVTPERALNNLHTRYNATIELIKTLPICQDVKDQNNITNKHIYDRCNQFISQLLKKYDIDQKKHLFNLIKKLNNADKEKLFLELTEAESFFLDISLLNNVVKLSEKYPLCILLAGAYHSNTIEKRLLSPQFQNFKKDISSSMTLQNLKLDDLTAIQWPNYVPDTFMNNNMKQFITIDHA